MDLIFEASRNRTGMGPQHLAFPPYTRGDSWETWSLQQPPTLRCLLAKLPSTANMKRIGITAEFVVNINIGLTGNFGLVAKALIDRYPDRMAYILSKLPEAMAAQLGHAPAKSFNLGTRAFYNKVIEGMNIRLNSKVVRIHRCQKEKSKSH